MIDLSTKPFEHLLLWSCWKTAYVLLYLHIYAIYPIHFLLLCANVCYCALYCASVHHFVLFRESSVPQKGPCGIHINGQFVTFGDLALCVADKKKTSVHSVCFMAAAPQQNPSNNKECPVQIKTITDNLTKKNKSKKIKNQYY